MECQDEKASDSWRPFNVPSNLPYYIAIIGSFIAIIIVKQLFGGLGHNLFNPAITARIVLFIAFATQMTTWPVPRTAATDAITGPTPLGILKNDLCRVSSIIDKESQILSFSLLQKSVLNV